jgi:quercetin dioxygenase-like cupin family protein
MAEIKKVVKVWGYEEWIANTEKYCGKFMHLKKGKRCSIHYHKIKDETFYILKGKVLMEIGEEKKVMQEGDVIRIMPGQKHRFSGLEDSIIIEFSTHHEEEDSYRDKESEQIPEEEFKKMLEEYK